VGRELCAGVCWAQANAHDPVHGDLRPPELMISATAETAMTAVNTSEPRGIARLAG